MSVWRVMVTVALVMAAAPGFAQTPAGQTPPAQQPPKPPAAPQAPPPAPEPPRPFPEGAKIAYVDFQGIVNDSIEGKAATTKVQAFNQKKVTELNEKQKALNAAQQKLQQGLTVLSDQARAQLEKEIEKMQVDIQRFTQDAQAEVQELQQALQVEFQKKVFPIIQQVATDKGLHIIFSTDAGIVWADRGLDITPEVIKRFDASVPGKPGDAQKPAPPKPPLP